MLNKWLSHPSPVLFIIWINIIWILLFIPWIVTKEQGSSGLVWPVHLPASYHVLIFSLCISIVPCFMFLPAPSSRQALHVLFLFLENILLPTLTLIGLVFPALPFNVSSGLTSGYEEDLSRCPPTYPHPVRNPCSFLSWHSLISVCLTH